jgi:hypothetical protein
MKFIANRTFLALASASMFITLALGATSLCPGHFFLLYSRQSISQSSLGNERASTSLAVSLRLFHIFPGRICYCQYVLYVESPCKLFSPAMNENAPKFTGYVIEVPEKSIQFSPNEEYILIIEENNAAIFDSKTLTQKIKINTPYGGAFGIYTALPRFDPVGRGCPQLKSSSKHFHKAPSSNHPTAPAVHHLHRWDRSASAFKCYRCRLDLLTG